MIPQGDPGVVLELGAAIFVLALVGGFIALWGFALYRAWKEGK